ncbi:2-hydroxyacyl-CoA dehydratase subunit D [Natranaerofaba carboxydovora]|uniref:2-hydroxyacyl-CoA dehydratase subunit D n=1 Tax=Natranaerofaba carboxydovora TaxID=2742683 RepID=UPI001F13E65B|nr:2-hydroxyacyl-CoA dehydratase family protein [Natranaerofaba carboxydovora]UMZ73127.1 (R)-2-hydroxyisocaproyl-CoA dehydratase beta subunit [Natranaerofaba carboxydovora]
MKKNNNLIGWFCTYVPEELIHAAGFTPHRILPYNEGSRKDKYLPPNFCPYVRNIIEKIEQDKNSFEGLIVANSCNAMLHLYNVVKENFDLPVHLLHVPRLNTKAACEYFAFQIKNLKIFLENINGNVTTESLAETIKLYHKTAEILKNNWPHLNLAFPLKIASDYSTDVFDFFDDLYYSDRCGFNSRLENTNFSALSAEKVEDENDKYKNEDSNDYILLEGALPSKSLLNMISNEIEEEIIMDNCLSNRYLVSQRTSNLTDIYNTAQNLDDLLYYLASIYLNKPSCPRIFSSSNERTEIFSSLLNNYNIKAVIYHKLSFCDFSNYEYLRLKNLIQHTYNNKIPILKINTELEEQESGQFKTRLDAFLEMIE